jgi:hypothetical protein
MQPERREAMSQLADWKCHKIVKAGKILEFGPGFNTPVTVEDVNGAPCKVNIRSDVFARGRPNLGDYLVIYEDGYKSWSPAKAFEDGYTRLDAKP